MALSVCDRGTKVRRGLGHSLNLSIVGVALVMTPYTSLLTGGDATASSPAHDPALMLHLLVTH